MTSKLTITREQLEEWVVQLDRDGGCDATDRQLEALIRQSLSCLECEPVGEFYEDGPLNWYQISDGDRVPDNRRIPLYRHAQPAPVVERDPIAWLNDAYLARGVVDGEAGSEDAGPGYIPVYREAGPQPAPVVQCPFPCGWDNLNKLAIQDAALVARGLVDGEPTTEAHRQAAIANSNRLLKVISDCRAAMLNHSPDVGEKVNCPEVPEGWVLVPREPTAEMIAAAMDCDDVLFNSDETFCVQFGNIYDAMIAAAPKPEE